MTIRDIRIGQIILHKSTGATYTVKQVGIGTVVTIQWGGLEDGQKKTWGADTLPEFRGIGQQGY
jgi:hypothetical protein